MVLTDLHSSKKESEMVLRKRNEDLKEDIARLLADEKERDAQWERAYATIDADARAAAAAAGDDRPRPWAEFVADLARPANVRRRPREYSARFFGVSYSKERGKFYGMYQGAEGKSVYLGYFDDEEAGARAYNAAVEKEPGLRCPINREGADGRLVPKPAASSVWRGVSWHKSTEQWMACRRGARNVASTAGR